MVLWLAPEVFYELDEYLAGWLSFYIFGLNWLRLVCGGAVGTLSMNDEVAIFSFLSVSVSVLDIGLGFELYNCPRCMGIMLPEGGLTGNSYGLQHALSPSVVGGFSIDKIKRLDFV